MRELQIAELCFVSGGGVFCGPQGSWASNFIPDSPFGFDFSAACERHDTRYLEGTEARSVIDSDFKNEMLQVADGNLVGMGLAYVYFGFVSVFGGLFYGSSNSAVTATDEQAAEVAQSTADYAVANSWGGDLFEERRYDNSFTSSVYNFFAASAPGGGGYFTPQSAAPGRLEIA